MSVPPANGTVLRALPTQLVELPDAVIVRRGASEMRVTGEGAREMVTTLFALLADGADLAAVRRSFDDAVWPEMATLIESLRSRRFLVGPDDPAPGGAESHEDVFYWHFGTSRATVADALATLRFAVVGVNLVSRRLVTALAEAGATRIQLVAYPLLCNLRLVDDDGGFGGDLPEPARVWRYEDWLGELDRTGVDVLVACTDFGGRELLRPWNRFAVERGLHFLPIALENLVGHVGPLVVPGESPCYECLRGRENSHLADPAVQRAAEADAVAGQRVAGLHPSMASILGDVAAVELGRVYGRWSPSGAVGRLVEVNLLTASMTPRRVLRLPRCPVCGPADHRSRVATTRADFRQGMTLNRPHGHQGA